MALTYFILVFIAYCFEGTYQLPRRNIGVYGGHVVSIQEVPYMVRITDNDGNLVCGGSIIHNRFILTAAHCVDPRKLYAVGVGSEDLSGGEYYDISKIFRHENYTEYSGINNVALLKLAQPLKYGKTVAKIKLSNGEEEIENGSLVKVAGWGETVDSFKSDNLLQVEIPIDDIVNCKEVYTHMEIDDQKQFCVGNTGTGPCRYDDGGPVTLNGVQIGIVLNNQYVYCGGNPKLLLKVSTYLRWIEKIMNKNL